MLRTRRYFGNKFLESNKSVYKWLKKAEAVTKTLPNGSEKISKGEYSVVERSRHQKRSRGEMANDCQFSSNKAADYGHAPSEKYNYARNQQSQNHQKHSKTNSDNELQSDSEQHSDSEQRSSGSVLPDSSGSDEDEDEEDSDESDKSDGEEDDGEV